MDPNPSRGIGGAGEGICIRRRLSSPLLADARRNAKAIDEGAMRFRQVGGLALALNLFALVRLDARHAIRLVEQVVWPVGPILAP
jgi:hypothetical protein